MKVANGLDLQSQQIVGLAAGSAPSHAVNKAQLDAAVAGVGGGSALTAQVSFNFAGERALSKVFAVPGATTSMRVLASAHADSDEHELDPLACSAYVVSDGNVRVVCGNTNGTGLAGTRLVNLIFN